MGFFKCSGHGFGVVFCRRVDWPGGVVNLITPGFARGYCIAPTLGLLFVGIDNPSSCLVSFRCRFLLVGKSQLMF